MTVPVADRRRVWRWLMPVVLVLSTASCEKDAAPRLAATPAVEMLRSMLGAEDGVSYVAEKRLSFHRDEGEAFEQILDVTHYAGGPTVFESHGKHARRWVHEGGRFYWLGDIELLLENYRVRETGSGEMLGRKVAILEITGRQPDRPSMTVRVDEETSLLLGAVITDWRGIPTTESEFLSLTLNPDLPPEPEGGGEGPFSRRPPDDGSVDLGFTPLLPRHLPAGFKLARTVRHGPWGRWGPRYSAVYSDGLGWLEISESAACAEDGKDEVATQHRRGSRTTLKVVLGGVKVRLVGRLDPEVLLEVLDSLAPVGGPED